MGKFHIKRSQHDVSDDPEQEEKARQEFRAEQDNRSRSLALLEYRIAQLREELATVLYDTMNLVRKKQTRGYEEVE